VATSSHIRSFLIAVGALLAVLALPSSALAADTYDGGVGFTCPGNVRGTMDRDYNLYMHCGSYVRIVRPDGYSFTRSINAGASQIAPSADGSILYAISYCWGNCGGDIYRFRLVNGSYVLDTNWRPRTAQGGKICGRGITTDVYGFIYVANGGWCDTAANNQVIKLRPDGSVVTGFGDVGQVGDLRGGFWNVDMDLAVTSDGRRIYVADHLNTRVQYFDWQWNGSYAYAGSWSVPSATYDVKLDPWGYVYATSTTQADVLKYTASGQYVSTVANELGGTVQGAIRIHNIAVDARGWVYAPESGKVYRRTGDNPLPGPLPAHRPMPLTDTRDPLVDGVTAPTETTGSSVDVTVAAHDPDGNVITRMRIADESGNFRAWTAWTSSFHYELTDGLGTKAVYVQVEDAAGRISEAKWAVIQRKPEPDMADPTVQLTAPATSTTNTVNVTIVANDDIGVTHIRFATEEGTFSDWEPWTSGTRTIPRSLTEGLGTRIVAIQVRDAAFKVSETAMATILVEQPKQPDPVPVEVVGGGNADAGAIADRVAPRITSIIVPRRSCSRRIVLRIGASDDTGVRYVRFANENGRFGGWRAFTPRIVYTLSRGTTRKVVYVQVRDAAGNISNLVARRTIVVRCR
jgi:hypothetical protein